ncbi:MAG: phospho-N-acetylmuramoyl-pentapeptide-transferase [Thermanaerothrix sp.]|nr:phospho-N-acetylmuramoyl-pentapeptide-transferase [Thermanaerothrix sp.]
MNGEGALSFRDASIAVLLLVFILTFLSQVFSQELWVRFMVHLKIKQNVKEYGPEGHVAKVGTPSMGGVVFPLCAVPLLYLYGRDIWNLFSLPLLAAAVGYLDDHAKVIRRSGDGLSSLQKLGLQVALSIPWCAWVSMTEGIYLWPGMRVAEYFAIPLLLFLSVGIQNAVNVTDGLDGLAAGTMAISVLGFTPFLLGNPMGLAFAVALLAVCLAFLWHNSYPARVFMGDGGAHFLAGALLVLGVISGRLWLLLPMGFLFGVEIFSVAIQIVAIRGFGRKVFKMSPIHHHFELIGWPETRIVARFWLTHILGMVLLLVIAAALGEAF